MSLRTVSYSYIPSARVMWVLTRISSGRMGSLHILRDDELYSFDKLSFIPHYLHGIQRMSKRTKLCSPICPSLCRATLVWTMISSGRISSLHILREDELENCILFLYTLCEGDVGINKIILRDGGLFTYPQGG